MKRTFMLIVFLLIAISVGKSGVVQHVSYPATAGSIETPLVSAGPSRGNASEGVKPIMPHAVAPQSGNVKISESASVSAPENQIRTFSDQRKIIKKRRATVLQKYLKIIRTRLHLSAAQNQKLRQIFRERRKRWHRYIRQYKKLKARYGRVPEARSFMTEKNFNKAAFKIELVKREAGMNYLRKDRKKRRIEWSAETLKEVVEVLTPQQRQKLIRITNTHWQRVRPRVPGGKVYR